MIFKFLSKAIAPLAPEIFAPRESMRFIITNSQPVHSSAEREPSLLTPLNKCILRVGQEAMKVATKRALSVSETSHSRAVRRSQVGQKWPCLCSSLCKGMNTIDCQLHRLVRRRLAKPSATDFFVIGLHANLPPAPASAEI